MVYLSITLNFSLPADSFGLTVCSLLIHAKLSAILCYIAHMQQQRQAEVGAVHVRSKLQRAKATQTAVAGGKEEMRAAAQDDEDEGEENEEAEAKRAALASKAFAATLSRRI